VCEKFFTGSTKGGGGKEGPANSLTEEKQVIPISKKRGGFWEIEGLRWNLKEISEGGSGEQKKEET